MRVGFEFDLRTEIKLQRGEWRRLSFERGGYGVEVGKPTVSLAPYLSMELQSARPIRELGNQAAVFAFHSRIPIAFHSSLEIEHRSAAGLLKEPALEIVRELKSWIRVLTRQYWIGYRERSITEERLAIVNLSGGGLLKDSELIGTEFRYGKVLDEETWLRIAPILGRGGGPRPSQLLFCDALLDVGEGDLRQAVVALGVSCELELSALIHGALGKSDPAKAEECEWRRFKEKLGVVGELLAHPFQHFDQDAAEKVQKVYKMRGEAVHGSDLAFVDKSKSNLANISSLLPYVDAVERFFEWSEQCWSALPPHSLVRA